MAALRELEMVELVRAGTSRAGPIRVQPERRLLLDGRPPDCSTRHLQDLTRHWITSFLNVADASTLADIGEHRKSCVYRNLQYHQRPMTPLDQAATRLEALGNPTRLAIYRLLVRAGSQGRPVGRIQAALDVAPSTLSHHLKHLEMAGLIIRRKEGVTHFCSANYPTMDALIAYLTEECCAEE